MTTTRGAHKPPGTKKSVKTMASFASILHYRWSTQASWTKKEEKKSPGPKVSENNDKLANYGNRLDQKINKKVSENNGRPMF